MADNRKGLDIRWTRHLSQSEKSSFEDLVRNSTQILKRLKEIFQEREAEINSAQLSLSDFDSPNWTHKTAFRNGQLSVLKQMKDLIPF
ncbi:MAG: hypothetical protein KGL39_36450 [Patescibacteria group bacterium]|nr:hypothetical protein [Patescibacteria group bacterium]